MTNSCEGFSIKVLLQNVKKESLSINNFLSKVKNIVDCLASVDVSPSDYIEAVFNELPVEYERFIISVNFRPEEYTMEEIESLLLAQETRIEKHSKGLVSNHASAQYRYAWKFEQKDIQRCNIKFKWLLVLL